MEELERLLKEKMKILKPKECAVIYDDERGLLISVCNEEGKIKIVSKKVDELQ
mgnify:CR=1 FL=1